MSGVPETHLSGRCPGDVFHHGVCEDCLWCLVRVFGWSARMSGLEDDLASMRRECDYWRRRTEEAEKASTFSQQQTSAAFEQAHLLSMYIPSARPEDPTGAGPSSPLQSSPI